MARARNRHLVELGGDHVRPVEGVALQAQPSDVVDDLAAPGLAGVHPGGKAAIADHFRFVHRHTPGGEQLLQVRALRVERIGSRARTRRDLRRGLRIGVDENHRPAALQHELVDRIQRRLTQVAGVDQQQHVDIGVDLGGVGLQRAEVEELAHRRHDAVGARLTAHRHLQAAGAEFERQAGDQSDQRLLRVGEPKDQLGQVILQELFLFRLEERDDLGLVGRVGADQAEIEQLAGGGDRHALQAIADGPVLGRGKRLWVDRLQPDLVVRQVHVFRQQIAHPVAVVAKLRHVRAELVGEE